MATKQPQPKKTVSERLEAGRSTVDSAMSFIDWIRYVVSWAKDLLGRG